MCVLLKKKKDPGQFPGPVLFRARRITKYELASTEQHSTPVVAASLRDWMDIASLATTQDARKIY